MKRKIVLIPKRLWIGLIGIADRKEDKASKKDKMARPKMTFMVGLAVCIILILGMDLPSVLADGMAFPKQSIGIGLDTDFSEDLQLVYIEVNETHQRTELFVAVKPLGKESYNLTLAVPMLHPPLQVDGGMMKTEKFRSSYGLEEAEHKSRRRNLTLGLTNTASYLNFFQQRTPLHNLLPLSSLTTLNDIARGYYYGRRGTWGTSTLLDSAARLEGVEHIQSYRFEGVSMDVYRFDDYPSLKGLLESLDLGVPDSARYLVPAGHLLLLELSC